MDNSSRLVQAYNSIDNYLRISLHESKNTPFSCLITKAAKINPGVRKYETNLREFSDLRNAIVHERTDGHVIAEPHESVVIKFERIKDLIVQPPKLRSFFIKKEDMITFDQQEKIGHAINQMVIHEISQAPILTNQKFIGLLTPNTIVRWLERNVQEDLVSLDETTIAEVLGFTENPNNYVFMSPDESIFDLFDKLQEEQSKGNQIEAFLFTNSAKKTETLLGILTIWDLPRLYQAITL